MEILGRYSQCQVLYLVRVAKCTKYISGILPTTKCQLLFLEMLDIVGLYTKLSGIEISCIHDL